MSRTLRLGAFIFGSLLILAGAIFVIGQKEFLFSRTYRLYSDFENVSGLIDGAEVRVGGVHVGTVDHVRLPSKENSKVTVVMDLENSTRKVLKKDSTAFILTEGLLGMKYVSISYGSRSAEPVEDGDVIQSRPPVDFSDLIAKSGEILESTEVTMKNLEEATGHLKSISSKVDRGEGTMGRLVNDKRMYESVNKTVTEAQAGVTAFQENMEALKKNWFFRGFFKDRGYADSTELTKYEVEKLPKETLQKKFSFSSKYLFEEEKAAKLKEKDALEKAGEFLEKNSFKLVVITAYSGQPGQKEESLELTRAQAMVVRKYLVDHFKIDDTRIKTKGFGEQPSKEKDQDRIEILIYG